MLDLVVVLRVVVVDLVGAGVVVGLADVVGLEVEVVIDLLVAVPGVHWPGNKISKCM